MPDTEPYHGKDRRAHIEADPAKPGTAVATALAAGSAAGAAAGTAIRQAAEYGSMGLKGWSAAIGNATGMLLVALFALFLYRDFRSEVRENREYQRDEMRQLRDDMTRQREHDSSQRELTRAEFRQTNAAVLVATTELRATRDSLEQLVKVLRAYQPKREPSTPDRREEAPMPRECHP